MKTTEKKHLTSQNSSFFTIYKPVLWLLIVWKSFVCGWFLLSGETNYLTSGITWTKGEGMSEIIASCITTVQKNVKYYLEARRLGNCLFVILFKLLLFQEEPPLPNGKTSLEQHHSRLLMNVFPSRQMCLPGTYKTKHKFYSVTFKCLSFFSPVWICFTSVSFKLFQLMVEGT